MTIHRPDFASVTLANDLRKLEEDWLKLEERATKPCAIDVSSDLGRTLMLAAWRIECILTRTNLIEGKISFDCASTISRMLEAAFDVARRSINGIELDEVPS